MSKTGIFFEGRNNDTKVWYKNGREYRMDGPAVEYANGNVEWYLNGKLYFSAKSFCNAAGITGQDRVFLILKYG